MKKKVVKQWIFEKGSERLKQLYKEDYLWQPLYLEEIGAGYGWTYFTKNRFNKSRNVAPTETTLKKLSELEILGFKGYIHRHTNPWGVDRGYIVIDLLGGCALLSTLWLTGMEFEYCLKGK